MESGLLWQLFTYQSVIQYHAETKHIKDKDKPSEWWDIRRPFEFILCLNDTNSQQFGHHLILFFFFNLCSLLRYRQTDRLIDNIHYWGVVVLYLNFQYDRYFHLEYKPVTDIDPISMMFSS